MSVFFAYIAVSLDLRAFASGLTSDSWLVASKNFSDNNPPMKKASPDGLHNSSDLGNAIAKYNHRQYEAAVTLLQLALLKDPTNAQAHYYYANCLALDGQYSAANYEYRACLQYSKNQILTNYCTKAVRNLPTGKSIVCREKRKAEVELETPESPVNTARDAISKKSFEDVSERMRSQFKAIHASKIDEKRKELRWAIADINQRLQLDIADVPQFFRQENRIVESSNYGTIISELRERAQVKIKILESEYQEKITALDEIYAKQLAELNGLHENLKDQMTSPIGASKLTQTGTSVHIRNYVNFGGVSDSPPMVESIKQASPGLLAKPGRLKQSR